MNKVAIQINHLSKEYTTLSSRPSIIDYLNKRRSKKFWALKDINLSIKKGEIISIIGPNGAGKTTLLRAITGITTPTSGSINIDGRVASIIDINAGFHSDLTGAENIMINGMIIGMTKQEIENNIKQIIEFSGLKEFINAPFHTLSSGMQLRLGFSIAIHSDPDILILDENIAVGDQSFREKIYKKINQFIEQKRTIVIASHLLRIIKAISHRVVWLESGKIHMDGNTQKVIREYKKKYFKNILSLKK